LESHRKEHEDLLREVRERVKALHEGKTFPLDGFSRFLQTWLVSHVSEKDTAFASWLKKLPEISPKG
jgi:hemerythrin